MPPYPLGNGSGEGALGSPDFFSIFELKKPSFDTFLGAVFCS